MNNKWDKILLELSYRVSSGIPDLTNEQHLMKLWDILKEHNWNIDARVELLKNILLCNNIFSTFAYKPKFNFKVSRLISILDKQTISMPNTNEANFIPLNSIITILIINKCKEFWYFRKINTWFFN